MTTREVSSGHPVRDRLRTATEDLHLELHRHPLLSRLQHPDLTFEELEANAAVSCAAVGRVERERARRALWPELSLSGHLAALRRDLGAERLCTGPEPGPAEITGEAGLLGALYVVHGSALGGAMLSRTVRALYPDAPRSFFVPRDPEVWRALCARLEALEGALVAEAERGAAGLFRYYRQLADAAIP